MASPLGSILGLLLFNIDICDMFLLNSSFDIASYVDDITYISDPTIDLIKTELEICCTNLFQVVQRKLHEFLIPINVTS